MACLSKLQTDKWTVTKSILRVIYKRCLPKYRGNRGILPIHIYRYIHHTNWPNILLFLTDLFCFHFLTCFNLLLLLSHSDSSFLQTGALKKVREFFIWFPLHFFITWISATKMFLKNEINLQWLGLRNLNNPQTRTITYINT